MLGRCVVLTCAWAGMAFAQVGEISLSGGVSRFGKSTLGTLRSVAGDVAQGPSVKSGDGFRLILRFTLNSYRFFGHEFGYAYSRSKLTVGDVPNVNMPIHQGIYNFLAYATPEGSHVRPFVGGGVHFSSFFPPGASAYYGNQITKFGVNYGAGIKLRATPILGLRFDVHDYLTGKPDLYGSIRTSSGMLHQLEVSGGVSFIF